MKKKSLICILIGAIATTSFAAYYEIPEFGETWLDTIPTSITDNYEGFTGGPFSFVFGDGYKTVGTFKKDFTFNSAVKIYNTTDGTSHDANMWHAQFFLSNGNTLTFNNTFELNASMKTRLDFPSTTSDKIGTVIINKAVTFTGGVTLDTCEFWLQKINLVYSAEGAQMGYTHFCDAPTVRAKDYDLLMTRLAIRSSTIMVSGTRDFGALIIDNANVTVKGNAVNNGSQTGNYHIQFANQNKAESILFEATFATFTNANIVMLFEGFGVDDRIYTINDIATSALQNLVFINGESLYSLVQNGTIIAGTEVIDTVTYFSYGLIPEPSTVAAIFGALALGLVIVRRRK